MPLIVIFVFCILLAFTNAVSHQSLMNFFMAYFFVFLAMFKFMDLKGFVEGFEIYDIVTKKFRAYGYIYPFIELLLGLGYLTQMNLSLINLSTFVVMTISAAGVVKSILSGNKFKCACLGTTLSVPLSTISIIENLGMGLMALYSYIML